jgi:hypothetical protein
MLVAAAPKDQAQQKETRSCALGWLFEARLRFTTRGPLL